MTNPTSKSQNPPNRHTIDLPNHGNLPKNPIHPNPAKTASRTNTTTTTILFPKVKWKKEAAAPRRAKRKKSHLGLPIPSQRPNQRHDPPPNQPPKLPRNQRPNQFPRKLHDRHHGHLRTILLDPHHGPTSQ